jgi:hypothetical protein
MTERKHIKRISYQTQRENCRADKSAFYEEVFPAERKVLMCEKFGGQCMPTKCRNMRVIKQQEAAV